MLCSKFFENPFQIAAGERVLGRIINLNKTQMSVMYELTNAQRAMLTATGMCNEYKQAFKRLQSLQLNEVSFKIVYSFCENPAKNFVKIFTLYHQ